MPRNDNRVRQALAFMVSRVDERGALGLADDTVADYPTYATAMALPIFRRNLGRPALADRMRDRLLATQYRRKGGWPETHPAFGAWGMGVDVQPPNPGHLDLSMTRHALEALIFERGDSVKAARTRALRFVDRLRSPSGGWFFSTVLTDKNKAGPDEPDSFRGYGTTTADAWLAYLAAGVPRDDERMQAAAAWLVKHHEVARVPGLPEDDPWAASMRYYYRAVSARVFSELDLKEAPVGRDWRQDVIEAFVKEQRPDGSFVSAGKLMKEDDPLIATGLVLQALGALRY